MALRTRFGESNKKPGTNPGFSAQHFQNISMNKGRQNTHQKTQLLRKKPTHADR